MYSYVAAQRLLEGILEAVDYHKPRSLRRMIKRMRPTIKPIKGMSITSSKSAASTSYICWTA